MTTQVSLRLTEPMTGQIFRPKSYLHKDVLKARVVDQEFEVDLPFGLVRFSWKNFNTL